MKWKSIFSKSTRIEAEKRRQVELSLINRIYDFVSCDDIRKNSQYYTIGYPCMLSIFILEPKSRFLIRVKKPKTSSSVEDIIIKDSQIKKVKAQVENLTNTDNHRIIKYICPFCGNIMKVIYKPISIYDNSGYECPYCHNRFAFGGTCYELPDSIYTISPNAYDMATHALLVNSKMIAELINGYIVYLQDRCLIVNFSIIGCSVIGVITLSKPNQRNCL